MGRACGLGRKRAAIKLGGMLLYWLSRPVCLRASFRETMQLVRIWAISVHMRDPTRPMVNDWLAGRFPANGTFGSVVKTAIRRRHYRRREKPNRLRGPSFATLSPLAPKRDRAKTRGKTQSKTGEPRPNPRLPFFPKSNNRSKTDSLRWGLSATRAWG